MGYMERWCQGMLTGSSTRLSRRAEAWGEFHHHSGITRYGRVKIAIGPGDALEVVDKIPREKANYLRQYDFYPGHSDQIVWGVLDVLMICYGSPCRTFRLVVLGVDFDEVISVPAAYRMAARQAARRIVEVGV